MGWLLLVIVIGGSAAITPVTAIPFSSQETCQEAAEAFMAAKPYAMNAEVACVRQ